MLAIATTESLVLSDPSLLKRSPVLLPASCSIPHPIASTWASDNSILFIAFRHSIHAYDPSGNHISQVYSANPDDEIAPCLVTRDKGASLIFAVSNKLHVLEYSSTAGGNKPSKTIGSHKSPVISLSLSNDCTLLASTCRTEAHIYNISLSSHTVLRGLPPSSTVTICTFSPHLRTRLIVGSAQTLNIYDTTRPSAPIRIISMSDVASGEIIALSCSPFSKALIAAACSGGTVGLIDLDKDKGLFKTITVNIPLTSLGFSPEGAAIYLGTGSGKLLLQDLRTLDKPPKSITVSENGDPIECLSIQRKLKIAADTVPKPTATTTTSNTKPLAQQDINQKSVPVRKASASAAVAKPPAPAAHTKPASPQVRTTPIRRRAISGALGGFKSPPVRSRAASAIEPTGTPVSGARKVTSPARRAAKVAVFSPPRETMPEEASGDVSVQTATLMGAKQLAAGTNKENRTKAKTSPESLLVSPSTAAHPHTRVLNRRAFSTSATLPVTSTESKLVRQRSTSIKSNASSKHLHLKPRVPSGSAVSSSGGECRLSPPMPSSRVRSRSGSSASQHKTSVGKSPLPSHTPRKRTHSSPSPARTTAILDLPSPSVNPITPFKGRKTISGVLGLRTPEVEKWIELGKGRATRDADGKRQVGFALEDEGDGELFDEQERSRIEEVPEEEDEEAQAEQKVKVNKTELEMQVSPIRPSHSTSASAKRTCWAPVPSPLRRELSSPMPNNRNGSPSAGAHSLLHTIIRDVMYDYQEDMRTEMMGMHLDLVRIGRDWKKEMREMMDVYSTDLKELREENRMLREENEKLRRGY